MPLESKNKIVCTGCSLLCDDIAVDVQFNKIFKVHNACLRGNKRFHFSSSKDRLKEPVSRDGHFGESKTITVEEALSQAGAMLDGAKKVLLLGGARLSNGGQDAFLKLSRKFDADVHFEGVGIYKTLKAQISSKSQNYFTIGEVINNSDTIIFWGANPIDYAPKLVVKTIFSRGRYRQSGKEVKKFIVVDLLPTPTMERADVKIIVEAGEHERMLDLLAAEMVKQGLLSKEDAIGLGFTDLAPGGDVDQSVTELAGILGLSEYTTIFLGESVLNKVAMEREPGFLSKILGLSSHLNRDNKTCTLPLFYPFNFTGLVYALSTIPYPIKLKDWSEVTSKLDEYDVILSAGFDLVGMVDDGLLAKIKGASIISLDYNRNPTTDAANVFLPVLMAGVETGTASTRLDGVTVNLTPCLNGIGGMKSEAEILESLYGDGE
ncbi:MAG: hypothetical protein ACTSUE_16945 [Promethearchaeota archaeon]